MFELSKQYSREAIHSACGGSKQAFLPAKNGRVVAACLRMDLNPQAPDVIICDGSASARAAGRTLAAQRDAIPVYQDRSRLVPLRWSVRSERVPDRAPRLCAICAPQRVHAGPGVPRPEDEALPVSVRQ